MYVKEYQEVTLLFPEDYHLVKDFESDKDWKKVSMSTVGATYIKCLKDVHFTAKATDQSPCVGCPYDIPCQPCKEYLEWEEKHIGQGTFRHVDLFDGCYNKLCEFIAPTLPEGYSVERRIKNE